MGFKPTNYQFWVDCLNSESTVNVWLPGDVMLDVFQVLVRLEVSVDPNPHHVIPKSTRRNLEMFCYYSSKTGRLWNAFPKILDRRSVMLWKIPRGPLFVSFMALKKKNFRYFFQWGDYFILPFPYPNLMCIYGLGGLPKWGAKCYLFPLFWKKMFYIFEQKISNFQ